MAQKLWYEQLAEMTKTKKRAPGKKPPSKTAPTTTRPEDRDILDVNQAAAYLAVARSTLYKLIERGAVPHMKIGGSVRFSRKMLLNWVESESKKVLVQAERASVRKKKQR